MATPRDVGKVTKPPAKRVVKRPEPRPGVVPDSAPPHPDDLLMEWLEWWAKSGPAKMPEGLHVKTAIYLQGQGHDVITLANMTDK